MGVTHVPSRVVAERQHMQEEPFWRLMGKRRWVHPFSPTGSREPLEALPQSLDQLEDDPYQSLAALARRAGAFRKRMAPGRRSSGPTSFRENVRFHDASDAAFALALTSAVRLARSRKARKLQGFAG